MSAPMSTAYRMPSATSTWLPDGGDVCVIVSTRTGRIVVRGATPTAPAPSAAAAAGVGRVILTKGRVDGWYHFIDAN